MKEMGSRYLFIVLYVWLEHTLSRGDYRVSPPTEVARARRGALDLSRERAVMLGLWSAAALACILGVLDAATVGLLLPGAALAGGDGPGPVPQPRRRSC